MHCGIANLGNTCFLNSCLQILNEIDEIARIHSSSQISKETDDDYILVNEWAELRTLMREAANKQGQGHGQGHGQGPLVNPLRFVKTVHSIAPKKGRELFTGWAQNDLPEFLQFMIECMHNSRKRRISMRINGDPANSTDDLAIKCYTMLKDDYSRGDYSEYNELFGGVYVSRLMTPDGLTTHSLKPESYCVLDLPIPLSNAFPGKIELLDCFDCFSQDELLSGWRNEKTNLVEPVRKNIVFWNFPRILIITLKRFSADGRRKNCALVNFPVDQPLDLSEYVAGYRSKSHKYSLFGVANHMGNVNGGHYTAFIRKAGEWLCCNDTSVGLLDSSAVVSPDAYCLFYRKI